LFEIDKMWNLSGEEHLKKDEDKKSTPKKETTPLPQLTPEKPKEEEKKEGEEKDIKILASKSGLDRLIKFAKEIQNSLKTKGTTKLAVKNKMSLKEARLVADTFYKAYHEDIPSLQINNETLNHLKLSKHLAGVDMVQSFPALFKQNTAAAYKPVPQPGQGPLIKLSRDQLQMTI
jgi:hypothetical protein